MNKTQIKQIKALATNDFQNRGGQYPKAGTPTNIVVFDDEKLIEVIFYFKNTDEAPAEKWVRQYLSRVAAFAKIARLSVRQDGDYPGDWVTVTAKLK